MLQVDLYNEPHNHPSHPDIVWEADGVGEPYNWRTAAMRAASAIQKVNPDLLICIQGMASHQTWNGADLRPVLKHPVKLKVSRGLGFLMGVVPQAAVQSMIYFKGTFWKSAGASGGMLQFCRLDNLTGRCALCLVLVYALHTLHTIFPSFPPSSTANLLLQTIIHLVHAYGPKAI